MRLIADVVLAALRTFDRPATRAEIERESGLSYDQVHNAIRTLRRSGMVIVEVDAPRRRALFRASGHGVRLHCDRGRYERDQAHRERMAEAVRLVLSGGCLARGRGSAAITSAETACGGARVVVRGVLDLDARLPATWGAPFVLGGAWGKGRL